MSDRMNGPFKDEAHVLFYFCLIRGSVFPGSAYKQYEGKIDPKELSEDGKKALAILTEEYCRIFNIPQNILVETIGIPPPK